MYTRFRWCRKNQEVLWQKIIHSKLGLTDGRFYSWQCICTQEYCGASTDRSCLGGESTCPLWCSWLNFLSSCRYLRGTIPRPWQIFVAHELDLLLLLLETDALSWCAQYTSWNSRRRLCRPGSWADPGELGRQREWVIWARIAHWWALERGVHVLLLQYWSRQTWCLNLSSFKVCGVFWRWVCLGWEWG